MTQSGHFLSTLTPRQREGWFCLTPDDRQEIILRLDSMEHDPLPIAASLELIAIQRNGVSIL